MPVRSSVCTYSPASSGLSNSKYSTVLPTPSSLSIGQYKPLSSWSSYAGTSSGVGTGSKYSAGSSHLSSSSISSGLGSDRAPSRYSLSTSSYSPSSSSSLNSSSYSSLNSTSSSASSNYAPTLSGIHHTSSGSGYYRPLSSAHNSFTGSATSRYGSGHNSLTADSPSRFSSGTSSSSSSISSATSSLLDRTESFLNSNGSNYVRNYQPPSPSLSSSRRVSYTSSLNRNSSLGGSSTDEAKLPAGVPKGLINLGNTCYMNAVIQSLYSIDLIRSLILNASHYDKILSSELSDLFKTMKSSSSTISPASFKNAFSRHQAKFSGLGQQDSQEFLRYLINGIHEECNKASKRPRRSQQPRPPRTAEEAWQQYTDIVDDSPLVDIVVGQLCSTIVCSLCQNKSYCWDPFWDLSLPLNRSRYSCKLSDVVQDFTAKETLDNDERPICSQCKKATKSTKQIKVCRLPPVMILHLKKFTNDGYKLSSPEVNIDRVLTFNENTQYNLTACISHHGHSSSSGHYTAHCKYSSRWFHFNDDRSGRVLPELVKQTIDSPLALHVPRYTQHTIERQPKVRRIYSLSELREYFVNFRENFVNILNCSQQFNDSCTSATSDIFCVTGGISAITGSLIACFGVYPKNQARVRLYLECFGCAMVILGVLILLLSLRMRARSDIRHNQHHHQNRQPVFESLLNFHNQPRRTSSSLARTVQPISLISGTSHEGGTNTTTRKLRFESTQDWQPTTTTMSESIGSKFEELKVHRLMMGGAGYKENIQRELNSAEVVGQVSRQSVESPATRVPPVGRNFLRSLTKHKLNIDEDNPTVAPLQSSLELELEEINDQLAVDSTTVAILGGDFVEDENLDDDDDDEESENTSAWLPPDVDDEEFYAQDHQVAVEAALSTVLTVSTLAGFRVVGGDANQLLMSQNQDYCCLHHAVQNKLNARKWIKRLKLSMGEVSVVSIADEQEVVNSSAKVDESVIKQQQ